MGAFTVPSGGVSLYGAPDTDIGQAKPKSKALQAMRLDLPDALLDELYDDPSSGLQSLQVCFGKVMSLKVGTKSHDIVAVPATFRHELYSTSGDNKRLNFAGLVSHQLQVRKAAEVTAGADAALMALQSNMAALNEEKKSKTTHFVADSSKLPPPVARPRSSTNLLKPNRGKLLNSGNTRSIPTSPSLAASPSPLLVSTPHTPTTPLLNQQASKLQTLRTPLIHLLAVRPATEAFLIKKTCCAKEDCQNVLRKWGERTDSDGEWRLDKRSYKDLDVWKFPYPAQADRQAAIDNAAAAFDRLRLSREDPLWQMLLPKHERGKGKILSKLHLHAGPIGRGGTPSIKLQQTNDSNEGGHVRETDVSDSGREPRPVGQNRRDTDRPRSVSAANVKVSNDGAKSAKAVPSKPAKKLGRPPGKSKASKESDKPETKANSKFKSSEFVEDSDEDIEMGDLGVAEGSRSQKTAGAEESRSSDDARKELKAQWTVNARASPQAAGLAASSKNRGPMKSSDSKELSKPKAHALPSKKNPVAQKRNTSPSKPSPLGSSPPTNASDMESEYASSSSSSPLITQLRRDAGSRAQTNGLQIKNLQNGSLTPRQGLKRGPEDDDLRRVSAKRRPSPPSSPPGADSYSSSSTSPPSSYRILQVAKAFKDYYANYERLYRGLARSADPPLEQVQKVKKMHQRLLKMKAEIARSAGGG